jgi:glutamine synthetase
LHPAEGDDDVRFYFFIGGVMHNAKALCAISNPVVNSYKRINAPATLSGATWAPNAVTSAGNNRTHMIRIPEPGRFELRLADGAANPYLLQAAVLATGLDGIKNNRDPRQAPRHQHSCRAYSNWAGPSAATPGTAGSS